MSDKTLAKKTHIELYSFVTYSMLFKNSRPSMSYLINKLRELDLTETVILLAKLNLFLSEKKYGVNFSFQSKLIDTFFNDYYKEKLSKSPINPISGNFVFHRHQLLFLLKYSLLNCMNVPNFSFLNVLNRYKFGPLCLVTSDFLKLTDYNDDNLSSSTDDLKKEVIWKELLASYELNIPADLAFSICRMRKIVKFILPNMHRDQKFIDIERIFLRNTGLSINDYMFLIFAVFAIYISRIDNILTIPQTILIEEANFIGQSNISPESINKLLQSLSLPLEQIKSDILSSKDCGFNYGFLTFRKYPLLRCFGNKYLCFDFRFLQDKIDGIFWQINDGLETKVRNNFHAFWGSLFENYIKSFVEYALSTDKNVFVPNPSFDNVNDEVADGILDYGEDIVLLEYKFAILPQDAKYSDSIDQLIEQIRIKYEKNQKGEWKGYGQLANSLKKLLAKNNNSLCSHIKLEKIKRVFPVLITYDHILNTPLTNYFFNKYFLSLIDRSLLIDHIEIMPLILITIEDFEAAEPFIKILNRLLCERIEYDNKLLFSFSDFLKNKKANDPSFSSSWVDNEYHQYFEDTKKALFPNKYQENKGNKIISF